VALTEETEAEPLAGSAFLVRTPSAGGLWLVATEPDSGTRPGRAFRYAMPTDPDQADALGDAMGFAALGQIPRVSSDWVNLFPVGPPLTEESFAVQGAGDPVDYLDDPGVGVGDLVSVGDVHYLLGATGPIRLGAFAAELYAALGHPATPIDSRPDVEREAGAVPAQWPSSLPSAAPDGPMCAVLHPGTDEPSRVSLAHRPRGQADPEGVSRRRHSVFVEPSRGAYVLSGSGESTADGGTAYVIDSKAQRYALVGPQVPVRLGYGSVVPPLVPAAWTDFFEPGVPLSLNAARRVPEDAPVDDGTGSAP
jgi:hypothetical protein